MKKTLIVFGLFTLLLAGCSTNNSGIISPTPSTGENQSCGITPTPSCGVSSTGLKFTDLTLATETALIALKKQNFLLLAELASKEGIRFSPYSHVDLKNDIVLNKTDILAAMTGDKKRIRGSQDGSGEPIQKTLNGYIEHYVYDVDFANHAEKTINKPVSRGNIINNISDIYKDKQIVEYYLSGSDPKYEGLDRKSLTLIFTTEDSVLKLIGIIHGEWTI